MTLEIKILLSVIVITILVSGIGLFSFICKKKGDEGSEDRRKLKEKKKKDKFHKDMQAIEKKY